MISYNSITNKGDRQINEDSVGCYYEGDIGLFIVADGLGGHGFGDTASHYVVEQYLMQYNDKYHDCAERYFSCAFASIQAGLLELQKKMNKDMKSTAAAVFLTDKRLSICYIGDSRVYVFGKRKILFRTLDHSVPQMLANAGEIKEKNIRFHPDRNRLLRALGEESDVVDYDMYSMNLSQNIDGILICSDGFWEYITERDMIRTLYKSDSAEEWISNMEKIVLKNGKSHTKDNYSAIGIILCGHSHRHLFNFKKS